MSRNIIFGFYILVKVEQFIKTQCSKGNTKKGMTQGDETNARELGPKQQVLSSTLSTITLRHFL